MPARKTYWQGVSIWSPASQDAIRGWLVGMADGMTCEKAEVLCDIETDAEKGKLRAFMTDANGEKRLFTRTMGRKFTITSKRL